MPDEVSLGGGAFASPAEGNAASAMGNSVVNSRLSVDLKMLQGLNKELNALNENTKKIKSNFKDLIRDTKSLTAELNKAATAMGKVSGKSGSGYMDMSKGMPDAANLSSMREMQMQSVERILSALGKGGPAAGGGFSGGGGGGGSRILGGLQAFAGNQYVQMAGQAIQAVGATIDNRVDRNRSYALPADRLSVQLQQQYGMSQQQVMSQLRGPLRQYRLGEGGINELLAMQSRTGLSARMQAGSVEGIRTLMGFGYGAGDVTNYIESMAQADTVNRMFMMTGTSMYGIGGTQKSAQQVNQELIQRLGLNNREVIQAGRQSGSVIRQRLQMAGLDEGAQDILLQYAESNVGFRERGGKGFYDPSKKADRERMGIEGNYATQMEETERVKADREEQMYRRQADNYAQMEKNLQNVNKLLKEFEDRLSGVIGAKTSLRGFGGILRPGLGILGGIAGFALGGPTGAMAGFSAGTAAAGFLGDAIERGAGSPGLIAARKPTNKPRDTQMLSQLKPILREPLSRLLSDRPTISIQGGYRSPEQQKTLFLSRYEKTDEKTDTYWNGSYWKKRPGEPMTAPPGLSYHEIGLAADLNFASDADRAWLKANAAKYGLDEFSRLGEDWHVQPKSVPTSRRNYEEGGAQYGTETDSEYKYTPGTTGVVTETGPSGQSGANMDFSAVIKQQMNVADSMAAFAASGTGSVLSSGPGKLAKGGKDKDRGSQGKTKVETAPGSFDPYELARILDRKKFKREDIWKMLAISWRESRWQANAHVNDHDDDSYGLFQINMLGNMGPKRAKDFGISDYRELLDPKTNAKAARILYGDGNLSHWSVNGNPLGNIPDSTIKASKEIAGSLGFPIGDPSDKGYSPRPNMSSPAVNVSAGSTTSNVFNINPTINISSTGNASMDAGKIAKEVAKLIEREVRMTTVRGS